MDVRVDADAAKLPAPITAAPAEKPPARATLCTRLVLAVAAAAALLALALGLGLGLGLGLVRPSAASSKPTPTSFNFKGVHSLAMAAPRSGRRLGANAAATTLLALSSSGNATAVEAPAGVIQQIFASPTNATVLVYWGGQPLYIGTVACLLAHVASDGLPVCIQTLQTGAAACALQNVNLFLPLIQFSPAGNVYYQCSSLEAAQSIKVFSATTKTTSVVIPAPTSTTSGYRVTAWAVVNDATGSVIAGLQDQSTSVAKGITALYSVSGGSSITVYAKDGPRFMLTVPGGLFIGYLANGPTLGGLKKFDPQNATGFEASKIWIGYSSDSPSYACQTVFPTAVNGGLDFMPWAVLESGHTLVGTWTSSQSPAGGLGLPSSTTVDAYDKRGMPRSNLLIEYFPQPQTLAATPFDAMIVIIAAEGATAAIAGLDTSGACLVSLYNRTANTFTTLLSQNNTGIWCALHAPQRTRTCLPRS